MRTRIVIADDHAIFRSGLRVLLEQEEDLEVVGEAGDSEEALASIARHEPDLLILDLNMPGIGGTRVAQLVLKDHPDLAIVVLTMHQELCYLRELFALGARAFILKKSTGTELVKAIRSARSGNQYIDPLLSGMAMTAFVGSPGRNNPGKRANTLTPREREVCGLLAYGHTNVEIGKKLHISQRTVESHRTNIMSKLDFKSRADLVRYAIDTNLLKLE